MNHLLLVIQPICFLFLFFSFLLPRNQVQIHFLRFITIFKSQIADYFTISLLGYFSAQVPHNNCKFLTISTEAWSCLAYSKNLKFLLYFVLYVYNYVKKLPFQVNYNHFFQIVSQNIYISILVYHKTFFPFNFLPVLM